MSQQNLPIQMKELAVLQQHGFNPSLIKLGTLSFESDKFICAKEVDQQGTSVIVCDVLKNMAFSKRKMSKADGVMMHPTQNIMAVRANNGQNNIMIQVYNLDLKQKLKDINVNYEITFWKWLDEKTIGLVSPSSVFILDISEMNSPPRKVFDRQGGIAGNNVFVMNLTCDSNKQWYALSAITSSNVGGQPQVIGFIQLYNAQQNASQNIEGFAPSMRNVKCIDENPCSIFCFIDKKQNNPNYKLLITDLSPAKRVKVAADVQMAAGNDFPVLMDILEKFGLIFLATNSGNLFIYEITKGILIFKCKVSEDSLLFSAHNSMTGGMMYINKSGKLLGVDVDRNNLLPFIMNFCKNAPGVMEIVTRMAARFNLPGAENIFMSAFKNFMQNGNYQEAAKIVAQTPGDTLRNINTINMFKQLQGNPQPVLIYFQTMMSQGKLNKVESIEMAQPLVQQGRADILNKMFSENKFTASEELSELVKNVDQRLSLQILMASGSASAHEKIIQAFAANGQFDKIIPYCNQNNYKPDWLNIIKNLVNVNASAAANLCKVICNRANGNIMVDINQVVDIFQSQKKIQELTSFMVEYLKGNLPEDAYLQTKILELNLYENTKAASVILESNVFTHYDKPKIAGICEKMGLYQVCLENYSDINDIKRIIARANMINPEYLVNYLGRLTPENCLICLHELLHSNPIQNLNVVIEAASRYNQRIPLNELVKLFETYGNNNGLFMFLSRVINQIQDPEIVFKYICAGVITNNFQEVCRVVKENDNYDPKKVLEFFQDKRLVDPRPFIILCDKHDFIEDLTKYLYKNKLTRFLENYVFTVNQKACPRIIGTLLDEECDESYIKQILNTVRGSCPIEPLVEEMLKRQKIRLIQKFLEDRADEGNPTPALHNALAMIYIETNNNAKDFLMNNKYYDPKVVGQFCEDRDPQLALFAYKKAAGKCDEELINLTNKNAMYRAQAQYLVESLNPELWKKVLAEDTDHKKAVTDQVIQVILPQTRNPDEVSVTVKAFIDAGLQAELMDLLEKLVLHNNEFSKNKSLQNLLILTSITADPSKVKAFLNRLDEYDGIDIAVKCIENGLFEEAFFIYDQKVKKPEDAIDVLIKNINDLKRAAIYAEKINTPIVWGKLGRALLASGDVEGAIDSFIKANDCEMYHEVINEAEKQGKFEELIKFLTMARNLKKDKFIDGELVYSLSRCNKLPELEALLSQSNINDLNNIADRLYDEKIYEPAKIIYEHLGNNARLASCYVHLKNYTQALSAAKRSNTQKCWKEVCFSCIRAGEFKLAAQAGNYVIQSADMVEEVIEEYEKYGAYEELINLFESNLVGERNHIITELGILYAKYQQEKLMDHCRNYYSNMNVHKVIRNCEQNYCWEEVVFLYSHYNGYDQALTTMIDHSPLCWKHDLYCQVLRKVTNSNLYNKSIDFYVKEQPQLLNDMLKVISSKVDLSTTVNQLKKNSALALAAPFLRSVQSANNYDVNEALNEIFIEEEDPENLKTSILKYSAYDQLSLAKKIENHPLLEFKRISALVYRKNKKFAESIEISKKLNFFKDAIDTALESGKEQYVNALLKFFAERKDKESFAACLYTCYEFIKPDVAMELAWRYGMTEMCMPFMIQTMRDLTQKMNTMQMKSDIRDEKDKEEKKHESEGTLDMNMFMGGNSLMIYQPGMQGNSGMGGMGMGGGMPGMNSGMGGFGNSGFGGNNNTGFGGNNNTGFGGNNSGFGFGQSQGMNNNNNNNMGMGGFGFGSNNNNQNNNQNNNTGFGF
jgi:clathrin heavy chain